MKDGDDERRFIPWSREKDEKAKFYGAVSGLLVAIITSGTGYLRVDKFGYSDFLHEVKIQNATTDAKIAKAIHKRHIECTKIQNMIDARFESIERADTIMMEAIKANRESIKSTTETMTYFQREYWRKYTR